MTTQQPTAERKFYFAPLGTISERPGGERNIVRGLFFPAANWRDAEEKLATHKKFEGEREILSHKQLKYKNPNAPQHARNDRVVDYFTNGKPGGYVFFNTHGDVGYERLHTVIPAGWKQVDNPKGRARENEFVPYAEQLLRQQEQLMLASRKIAEAARNAPALEKKDGQIVVLDKATPFVRDSKTLGHLLRVRITEPGIGKGFGTPGVFFVHSNDMPGFKPSAQKPGAIIELPENALKVMTRTVRLTRYERGLIDQYIRDRKARQTERK